MRKELILKTHHVQSVLEALIAKEGRSLAHALLGFIAKVVIHHQLHMRIPAQLIIIVFLEQFGQQTVLMAIIDLLEVPYRLQIVYHVKQVKYVNQVKVLLNALQAFIVLLEKPFHSHV